MREAFRHSLPMFLVLSLFCVNGWAQETIDFEGIPAGTIVSSVTGSGGSVVGVSGFNPVFGAGTNAAMIYDSDCPPGAPTDCSGGDWDLGTPNETFGGPGRGIGGESGPFQNDTALGNLLIISEDLDSSDPDDADVVGAAFTFDFSGVGSGSATISEITIIDVEAEEPNAMVELLDGSSNLLAAFALPQTGDNGVAIIGLGPTPGVVTMVVTLNGSGAIDNIVFTPDDGDGGEGCTPGFWKQPQHLPFWAVAPDTPFGDIFDDAFPGLTLFQVVNLKGGGLNRLGAHTVAAYLNALSPEVDYAFTAAEVVDSFNAVFPGSNSEYNALKDIFVAQNEISCPIG